MAGNDLSGFAYHAAEILKSDPKVIGLAVAGSWITNELDNFSDLDLILVTAESIGGNKSEMLRFANQIGTLLSGFTGEHVGEPRLLICLYDDPLLHVDIKFLTLSEFKIRIETPFILLDTQGRLQSALEQSEAKFPFPDYQWIEDRFWIWIHYALLKIGRGEVMEAFDFFSFLRMQVFGPLLHIQNGNLPRGVRKVEMQLKLEDFNDLKLTIPLYDRQSLLLALKHSITLYQKIRASLFDETIIRQTGTEQKVLAYFEEIG